MSWDLPMGCSVRDVSNEPPPTCEVCAEELRNGVCENCAKEQNED